MSLEIIYQAFRDNLDFLRCKLYFDSDEPSTRFILFRGRCKRNRGEDLDLWRRTTAILEWRRAQSKRTSCEDRDTGPARSRDSGDL